MKPFHTVAVPHDDVAQGNFSLDVYAANLWDVRLNTGVEEYRDAERFFKKTHMTIGLNNLLVDVENRLCGRGGDPVIQLQTPFGGGKTHALIAMYHKAKLWGAKPVAIVGEKLNTGSKVTDFDTFWGQMEEQLTGGRAEFSSHVPPGGDQIRRFLEKHQPVLILIDEPIPYLNTADAVAVGNAPLTTLTLTFIQNLTNVASEMSGVALALTTTPSNPYNNTERGSWIAQQLQSITGRREIIKSPVQDDEVQHIIRKRLFKPFEDAEIKPIVTAFVDYADKNGILPGNVQPGEYRDRFMASYPFLPEVVDVLYHRWGTFPKFQRTRGVLRFLSLIVHTLAKSKSDYISLADVDLSVQEIRQELIKHIGIEYNSVIAADITNPNSGSKRVDENLGSSYRGLKLGVRAATTIFMYSFSGAMGEPGVTSGEIKRQATTLDNPASIVTEALEQFKTRLFYLQNPGDKYYFKNQSNLNLVLLNRMENVREEDMRQREHDLIKQNCQGKVFEPYLWKENPADVADNERFKLVILRQKNESIMQAILKNKGQSPRIYTNTIFFLCSQDTAHTGFLNQLKRALAYESIERDAASLQLSEEQKKQVRDDLKKAKNDLTDAIRGLYRLIVYADKNGLETIDMGNPTYGSYRGMDAEVFEALKSKGRILDRLAPIVLKEKYLTQNSYVETEKLYNASLNTPGEKCFSVPRVLEDCIREGVKNGLFGLGELENGEVKCRFYPKDNPTVSLAGSEIIIAEYLCIKPKPAEVEKPYDIPAPEGSLAKEPEHKKEIVAPTGRNQLQLRFEIPRGKVSNMMGILNYLHSKFGKLELSVTATNGSVTDQEFEDKVAEAFRQLGIEPEESPKDGRGV